MYIKLKAFFALAAIAMALIPHVGAQSNNHTPGAVVSWRGHVNPYVTSETHFTNIAAGGRHSLALKSDGTVVTWGAIYIDGFFTATVPGGLTGVVAIAAGWGHSLALKAEGSVAAWGYNDSGQSTVPGGLNGAVAIDAGYGHSLALKADGTVVAWGNNLYGERMVPDGLSGVVAIAAGSYHSLALKSDGTVVAWGATGPVPGGLTGVVGIAAGGLQSLALVADAPALVVQAGGNNVLLSWPLSAPGFALQSTTNLTDQNSWTTLTTSPVIVDSQNRITETISGPAKF